MGTKIPISSSFIYISQNPESFPVHRSKMTKNTQAKKPYISAMMLTNNDHSLVMVKFKIAAKSTKDKTRVINLNLTVGVVEQFFGIKIL